MRAKAKAALFASAPAPAEDTPAYELNTVIVDTPEALADLAEKLRTAEVIALDTETTGTDAMSCKPVGFSFAVTPGTGYYIPVGHREGEPRLSSEAVVMEE